MIDNAVGNALTGARAARCCDAKSGAGDTQSDGETVT